MEVIIKPFKDNLDSYIEKRINNFLLPLSNYSVEYLNSYTIDDIKKIKSKYSDIQIFVSINKNILNKDLEPLKEILKELEKLNIKGIFYYDLALLSLKKELNLNIDLVWNQTHMVTNYKTCDYYYSKGVKYALLSKEITKEEIKEILNQSKITSIVELISYPTVAFSKRTLVKNYYKNYGLEEKENIEIIEPKTNQKYLLNEDKNGVSFILNKLTNGSSILRELLENNLPYILLKEDLINHDIFLECITNIKYYIDNYKNMTKDEDKEWLNKQSELLGRNTNFFYRKTIYKVK